MDPMSYNGYPTGSVPSPLYVNQPGISHTGVCHVYPHQARGMHVYYQHHLMGSPYYNCDHEVMPAQSNYTTGIQPRAAPFTGSAVHYPISPVHPGYQYVSLRSPPPPIPPHPPQPLRAVPQAFFTQPLSTQSPSVNRDTQFSSQRSSCDGAPLHSESSGSRTTSPTIQQSRFIPPRLQALVKHYNAQGIVQESSACNSLPSVSSNTSGSSLYTLPWISSSTSVTQSLQSHVMPSSDCHSVDSSRTSASTLSTDSLGSFLNTNNSGTNFNRQVLVDFYVQKHAKTDIVESPFENIESNCELDGTKHTKTNTAGSLNESSGLHQFRVNDKIDKRTGDGVTQECVNLNDDQAKHVNYFRTIGGVSNSFEQGTSDNTVNKVINSWEEDLVDYSAKHQDKCLDNVAKANEMNMNNKNVETDGDVDNCNAWNAVRLEDADFVDEFNELETEHDDLNDSDGFIEEHEFMSTTVLHSHHEKEHKFECKHEEQMDRIDDVFSEIKCNHKELTANVEKGKNLANKLHEGAMVDEAKQVVESTKTRDANCKDMLHLKYEEIINRFEKQIDDKKILVGKCSNNSDNVGDLARIIVEQAIANGVCKFYKSLLHIKDVPIDDRKMDVEVKVKPVENHVKTSKCLYSWEKNDYQLDEDTCSVTHQPSIETNDKHEASVEHMTIAPQEEKGEDFEKFFFKQTASKHGITIESPNKRHEKRIRIENESQWFKEPSDEPVVQEMEKKSTPTPTRFVSARTKSLHHSLSFSEDSARSSRESSVSDAVEAFKIKASMRGIHIKDELDGMPDSDSDVDSVLRSGSKQGSVDGDPCGFMSTPGPSNQGKHFASSDITLNGQTRHLSGLRPDALEFHPDSVNSIVNASTVDSNVDNSVDTSLRLDAPEFTPDSAKTVSNLQANAAVFEPKKKITGPKIFYIPTPIEKVQNPSIGVQASPETCSVYVGTKSTQKKESGTITSSCVSREVAVNTDNEDFRAKYPERYVLLSSPQELKYTKNSPTKRSVGINVQMTNSSRSFDVKDQVTMTDHKTSDCDIDKAGEEMEINVIKDKFRQLQIELMRYKEIEFNMKLSEMKESMVENKNNETGIYTQQWDSTLELLEEASVKVKLLVYKTITSIQSGTYMDDLPDLLMLLPDPNVIPQEPTPSCNNFVSEESDIRHSGLPKATTSKENKADISIVSPKQKVVKKPRGMLELEDSSDDEDYFECGIVESKELSEQKSEIPDEMGDFDGDEKTYSSEMYSACSEFESIDEDTECESHMPTRSESDDKKTKSLEAVDDNTLEDIEPIKTDFKKTAENLDPLHYPNLKNLTSELSEEYKDQFNAFHAAGDGNVAIDTKNGHDCYASVDKISKLMHEEYSKAINSTDTVWYFNGDVGSHVSGDIISEIGEDLCVRCEDDEKTANINNNAGNIDSERRHGVYNKAEQGAGISHRQERIVTPLNEDTDMAGGDHLDMVETLKDNKDSKEASKGYRYEFGDGANPNIPPGLTTSDVALHVDSDEVYLSPEKQPSTKNAIETIQVDANIDSSDETNTQSDGSVSVLPSAAATGSDVVGMGPLPVMFNNLNPALYQAVLAQLIQSYPDLACNQEMLTRVAVQQTYLLQMYINNQSGNACTSSSPDSLLESQNISTSDLPSITRGTGEITSTELSSFPSSSKASSRTPDPFSAQSSSSSLMSKSASIVSQNSQRIGVKNASNVCKTRSESVPVKPPGFTLKDDLNIITVDLNNGCKSDHEVKSSLQDASKQSTETKCAQTDNKYGNISSVNRLSVGDNNSNELQPMRLPHNATQTKKFSGFRPTQYVANVVDDKASVSDMSAIVNDNLLYRTVANDMKPKKFSGSMPLSKSCSSNSLDDINLFDTTRSMSEKTENSSEFSKNSSDLHVKGQSSEKFSDSKPTHHTFDPSGNQCNRRDEFRSLTPSNKVDSSSCGNNVESGLNDWDKRTDSNATLSNASSSACHSSTSEFITPNLPPRLRKKQKENRSQLSPKYNLPVTQSTTPGVGLHGSTAPSFGQKGSQSALTSFGQQGSQSTLTSFGQQGSHSTTECWDDEVDDFAETFSLFGVNIHQQSPVIKPDKSKNLAADQTSPFISVKKSCSHEKSSNSISALDAIQQPKMVKSDPVAKTTSETSEEWCEVQTRRRRHSGKDQQSEKRKVSKPDTNTAPARTQSKAQKMSNFERLVVRLQDTYPDSDRQAVIVAIGKIRDSRGSLSGLSMESIVEKAGLYLPKRPSRSSTAPPSSKRDTARNIPGLNYDKPKRQTLNLPKYMPSTVTSSCEEEICVICHDPLTSEPVKELDCRHVFHTDCISQWVQQERTCPTCRTHALFPEDFPRLGK